MPDYQESTVTGSTWQRCHQVVIENPRHGDCAVRFDEERVLSIMGGAEMRTPAGTLTLPFAPAAEIPLRAPDSGELTGKSVRYGEVYQVIYSAYLDAAMQRDAAIHPAPADIPAPTEA